MARITRAAAAAAPVASIARFPLSRALSRPLLSLTVVLCLLGAVPTLSTHLRLPGAAAGPQATEDGATVLSGVRLAFEPNRGQADSRVAFQVKAGGATVYFTPHGVTNILARPDGRGRWVVEQRFVATHGVEPVALRKAPGVVSYFKGSPEDWITRIPTYRAIVYRDLWPGIDMVWRGLRGSLEYRFIVHPGADPSLIRLAQDGATRASITKAGDLLLDTPAGDLAYAAPVSFQERPSGRAEVASRFDLQGDRYGFRLGRYDPSRTLVIDPVIAYSGYIGGSGGEGNFGGVVVDPSGAAYVVGETGSTEATFPVTGGPGLTHNSPGVWTDAFVAKVAPSGATLSYAGYIGGSGGEIASGVAVDSTGAAYVAGYTDSSQTSFPELGGPDLTHNGGFDAFVAKVHPSGASLSYAGYIGGAGTEELAEGLAVDSSGAAYVAGYTDSSQTTFPEAGGPDLTYNGGPSDAFVAKVRPTGTSLIYGGYIGGSGQERGRGVAVDSTGAAYVTGNTDSTQTSFPEVGGPDLTHNGGFDAFVAKVRSSGASLSYAGYIGGSSNDFASGVAVDSTGAAYVAGLTFSTQATFPVAVGPDLTHNGGYDDAFVAKVPPSGTSLAYAGYIGGSSNDTASGVAVDSTGAAYVAGSTKSPPWSFPVTGGPGLINGGWTDAFLAKVAPSGTSLSYAGYIGGSDTDYGRSVAVDRSGAAYVVGMTASSALEAFPVAVGPDLTHNGSFDAFVVKVVDP